MLVGRLTPVVDGNLRAGFADDQRAVGAEYVKLDLADVRVTGRTDAA